MNLVREILGKVETKRLQTKGEILGEEWKRQGATKLGFYETETVNFIRPTAPITAAILKNLPLSL